MFDNKTFEKSDEGVSPVIGVILMVAITVVLAAVIGTFVLNLTDNLDQNAQAAVSFDETVGTEVSVTLNNVQSADAVYVNDTNGNGNNDAFDSSGTANSGMYLLTTDGSGGVGTTATVDTSSGTAGTVQTIGVLDGEENIIQTYDYNQ